MADTAIEELYRATFTDRSISPEENADLIATLNEFQTIQDGASTPPALTPDKFVWLRAAAFRIACEYLVEDGDDDAREDNVKLLKTINGVVSVITIQLQLSIYLHLDPFINIDHQHYI